MSTVHVLTGLPASGKTTHARKLVAEAGGALRRVNLDEVRAMLTAGDTVPWSRELEGLAVRTHDAAVQAAVEAGLDVVVDNTHLTHSAPNRLKRLFFPGEVRFEVYDLTDVSIGECIAWDAARGARGERAVGEQVIRKLADRLAAARRAGWRLTDAWMNDTVAPEPYVPDVSLPVAEMCDIDGTLALHRHRGPYDLAKLDTDEPNPAVADRLRMNRTAGRLNLLLSGRDEEYRRPTTAWLALHDIPFDHLWMRPEGDTRRDDVVKLELFDQHIRSQFNVVAIQDDRDRVIRLWRRGLRMPEGSVAQVNYGDF